MEMSVPRSARATSDMQFLLTARELRIFTIRRCAAIPKRYTFYVAVPLSDLSKEIYGHVKRGNSIYPTNQHEAQLRKDEFIYAVAVLQDLVSELEADAELIQIEERHMKEWMELVNREINLIKAVIKSDKARYKDLP
jgi:hypothetical protein